MANLLYIEPYCHLLLTLAIIFSAEPICCQLLFYSSVTDLKEVLQFKKIKSIRSLDQAYYQTYNSHKMNMKKLKWYNTSFGKYCLNIVFVCHQQQVMVIGSNICCCCCFAVDVNDDRIRKCQVLFSKMAHYRHLSTSFKLSIFKLGLIQTLTL